MLAIALAGLIGLAAEAFARSRGFAAEPNDDADLWSIERAKADDGSNVLAIAGSSRSQVGLKLSVLRERFPDKKVVQLSVAGGAPVTILNDLAHDKNFSGTVLCEVLPHLTFTNIELAEPWPGYSSRQFSAGVESQLRARLKAQFAMFRPDLAVSNVVTTISTSHRLPKPGGRTVSMDRQAEIDFSVSDAAAAETRYGEAYSAAGTVLSPAAMTEKVARLRRSVETIGHRGGSVVFFQMPSSGVVREVEERRFPDDLCWNVFKSGIGAPAFRSFEVPTLAGFRCAEGAHLDRKDIVEFTRAFCDELQRQSLVN
jgi:hypothetical protein